MYIFNLFSFFFSQTFPVYTSKNTTKSEDGDGGGRLVPATNGKRICPSLLSKINGISKRIRICLLVEKRTRINTCYFSSFFFLQMPTNTLDRSIKNVIF